MSQYYVEYRGITDDDVDAGFENFSEENKTKFYERLADASKIRKFNSWETKVAFERAFKIGYLASKMLRHP